MADRLQIQKPPTYSPKVLTGPWVYTRINAQPQKEETFQHTTTYREYFNPKPISRIDPAVVWDQKLNSEESNFIPQTVSNNGADYFQNFSSTYDLSYNHFPKCLEAQMPRKFRFRTSQHEPVEPFIESFGNLTNYGLIGFKREEWQCDVQDPRRTPTTHYNDTFLPPKKEDYDFFKYAIPKTNSTKIQDIFKMSLDLQLRDRPILNVPPPIQLVQVPKPAMLNPITWECIPGIFKEK